MKKKAFLSVILSILMLLPIVAVPASAEETERTTIHYFNENSWANPYVYCYNGGDEVKPWPGEKMESEGDGWYTYVVYGRSSVNAIFSDNGNNQNPGSNQPGIVFSGEMWYYKGDLSSAKPEKVESVIHYYNENNWSTPYVYFYTDSNQPVEWPGVAMTPEGGNWYSYTIADMAEPKVIFSNNGQNQCPAQGEAGLSFSGEKWYLNGTFYDSKPEGITVHYQNYDNWNNVNIYYYDGDRTGSDWTGNPMTADGDGWYTYKIYGYDRVKVLFNNGGNIQIPGRMEPGFDVSGEMWYRNGEWTTERPDGITVYFYKPNGWGTPNIYYYKSDSDTGKAWPGEQMKSEGDNWYSFTITKYDAAKVMFNSNSNQIPAQNQPGLDAKGVMWYKDGVWCDAESDTDGDGLPDFMEMLLGTNINNSDSDGDGLPDGYEYFTLGIDPLNADSNDNGVNDGAEDADVDGLTNLKEYNLGTDPMNNDSDGDGLTDGEEVNAYHTDPLKTDTDGDGLSDYDEVQLVLNPLVQDSNGDGINDCDEKFQQTISYEIECEEKPEVTDVTVSFSGTGNINTTTTIDNIYNIDMNSSGVVGLIGAPVEITSESQFEEAVITFTYDDSKLGDTPEENLSIMWYDEENGQFIILDRNSVVDAVNNTVSCTTTHFSKYMLVDSQQWYDTWRTSIDYRTGSYNETYYDFAFVIDTSGSMSGSRINYAKTAMNNFIDCLSENDHAGLVEFNGNASVVCPMGSSKDEIKSGVNGLSANGGTRVSRGLSAGINQLMSFNTGNKKAVILICDGDVDSVDSIVDIAYSNNITIYTVNVVSSSSLKLQSISDKTGGEYYYASNSSELVEQLDDLCGGTIYGIDLSDSDGDGLPDTFERNGMRLSNGQIIYTDPFNPDTDGDGISDGQEIVNVCLGSGIHIDGLNLNVVILPDGIFYIGDDQDISNVVFFNLFGNPSLKDTDGDGIYDCDDPHPTHYDYQGLQSKGEFGAVEYKDEVYNIVVPNNINSDTVATDTWKTVNIVNENDITLDMVRFIKGLKLSSSSDKTTTKVVYSGYEGIYTEETSVKLGVGGVLCSLLSDVNDSLTGNILTFTFQESSSGKKRVLITTSSVESKRFYSNYAGGFYNSHSAYAGSPLAQAIGSSVVRKKIIAEMGNENDYPLKDIYALQMVISPEHRENNFSSYLWFNSYGQIMETPIIYPDDKVSLGRMDWFVFSPIVELPLGGVSEIDDAYQALFYKFFVIDEENK